MTARRRSFRFLLGVTAAAGAIGLVRLGRRTMGRSVPGGTLIGHVALYDTLIHRILLRPLFERIATDVAALTPAGAKVLDVGCGPGRLSILLARRYGLEVTGLDLDPAMIERARANAAGSTTGGDGTPSFVEGDVAAMAFREGSFDAVVSTLSMHHWADVTAGLNEIGRVLRPGGRAFVWDLRAGKVPLHRGLPDPVERVHGSSLRIVRATPWRWPWKLAFLRRIELERVDRGV